MDALLTIFLAGVLLLALLIGGIFALLFTQMRQSPLRPPSPETPGADSLQITSTSSSPPPDTATFTTHAAPAAAAPPPSPAPTGPASTVTPRMAPPSLVAALLARGTRRTLLFLGSFLLLISSLTLVIFSWSSMVPVLQLAILGGTIGVLWALGEWLQRRPDLGAAGQNLQLLAALLIPVLGLALARPGMLDLNLRSTWQLTGWLSLWVYLLMSWHTRRACFAAATLIAALGTLPASLTLLSLAWQPVPQLLLLAAMPLLVQRLRAAGAHALAEGLRWVTLVAGPLLLLGLSPALLMLAFPDVAYPLTAALTCGTLYAGMIYHMERQPPWLWLALSLPPLALVVVQIGAGIPSTMLILSLSVTALLYLLLSGWLAQALRPAVAPLFAGALLLALFTLPPTLHDPATVRLVIPLLILLSLGVVLCFERGHLAWLGNEALLYAASGLFSAAALLCGWLGVMLSLWLSSPGAIAQWLLPLAALFFVGAAWWPGRLRWHYARSLRLLALAVMVVAGGYALLDSTTRLGSALLLALIAGLQAGLRPSRFWAALSLGAAAAWLQLGLQRLVPADQRMACFVLASTALAVLASLAGKRLRGTPLAAWAWPAIGWSTIWGLLAASSSILLLGSRDGLAVMVYLLLAGLLGLHSALWPRPVLGYPAAGLLAGAGLLAASQGFFSGWQPAPGDLGLLICGLSLSLALFGQALRYRSLVYARPYEHSALLLLPLAPLAAGSMPVHLSLTWGAVALLCTAALWRYRLAWLAAAAWLASDLALFNAYLWLVPADRSFGSAPLLASAISIQALLSAWLRRKRTRVGQAGGWGYLAAAVGAVGTLVLALPERAELAVVAGLFAGLLLLLSWIEQYEAPAWAALGLGLLSAWLGLLTAGLSASWAMAWLGPGLLGLVLLGWGLRLLGGLPWQWQRVSSYGALAASLLVTLVIGTYAIDGGPLPALTFALANLGLLLATLAVRERRLRYAYLSGVVLLGAGLCQLADWGLRDPRWYALPAGSYLLVLADGLRRYQGRRQASQLIETAAIGMLLGISFSEVFRSEQTLLANLILLAEALAVAAYGLLARLRVPFGGGVACFVAAVLWMSLDTLRLANQWGLLGVVGLLMVAAYVLLERHHERLARAGRAWAARLQHWA